MKLVVIESPFAGDVERNLRYVRAAIADCFRRGEAPYASHALFTQPGVLDDGKPEERKLGMEAGFAWGAKADLVVVYTDLGISRGMLDGAERAYERGTPVEYRRLEGWARICGTGDAGLYGEHSPITRLGRCSNCGEPDGQITQIFGGRYVSARYA